MADQPPLCFIEGDACAAARDMYEQILGTEPDRLVSAVMPAETLTEDLRPANIDRHKGAGLEPGEQVDRLNPAGQASISNT